MLIHGKGPGEGFLSKFYLKPCVFISWCLGSLVEHTIIIFCLIIRKILQACSLCMGWNIDYVNVKKESKAFVVQLKRNAHHHRCVKIKPHKVRPTYHRITSSYVQANHPTLCFSMKNCIECPIQTRNLCCSN